MENLYEDALDSINQMYEDTSIEQHEIISNLEQLKEEIDTLIESLN
jgi:hypothetical protein